MLSDNHLSDAIASSNFQDLLNSYIIPVSAIARDDKLLVCVGQDGENRGNEVLKVVGLVSEDAGLLAQATRASFLVLVGSGRLGCDLMSLLNHRNKSESFDYKTPDDVIRQVLQVARS